MACPFNQKQTFPSINKFLIEFPEYEVILPYYWIHTLIWDFTLYRPPWVIGDNIMKFQDRLMPVHVSLLTYQYTTTVTQPCASTLTIPDGGKSQTSNADDLLSKTQMLPWQSVFSPSQVLWGIIIIQLGSSWGTSYRIIKRRRSYWHKSIIEDRLVPWYHSRCTAEMCNSTEMWIL